MKNKCQVAFEEYFKKDPDSSEEFLVVRICSKMRKHGISWTIAEIADYHLRSPLHIENKNLLEILKGSSRKVRVMMPPENFNAFGNKLGNLLNFSRFSSSSTSSNDRASNSSSVAPAFHINGLVTLYSPTFLLHDLPALLDLGPDTSNYDQTYLTVMPRSI